MSPLSPCYEQRFLSTFLLNSIVFRFDAATDTLHMSKTMFKSKDLRAIGRLIVHVVSTLKLAHVTKLTIDDQEYIEMNNLTLINFVIYVLGPLHERNVVLVLMGIQVSHTHGSFCSERV